MYNTVKFVCAHGYDPESFVCAHWFKTSLYSDDKLYKGHFEGYDVLGIASVVDVAAVVDVSTPFIEWSVESVPLSVYLTTVLVFSRFITEDR